MEEHITIEELYETEPVTDEQSKVMRFLFEYVDANLSRRKPTLKDSPAPGVCCSASLVIAWGCQKEFRESITRNQVEGQTPIGKQRERWKSEMKVRANHRVLDALDELEPIERVKKEDVDAEDLLLAMERRTRQESTIFDPAHHLTEEEKHQRREVLLSTLFHSYVLDCEKRDAQLRKEIFERRMVGQTVERITEAIGYGRLAQLVKERLANPDAIFSRIREVCYEESQRLNRILQQLDRNASIAPTLHSNGKSRRDSIASSIYFSDAISCSLDHLVQWIVAGNGLCPSDDRLRAFQTSSDKDGFADVEYHLYHRRLTGHLEPLDPSKQDPGCSKCRDRAKDLVSGS